MHVSDLERLSISLITKRYLVNLSSYVIIQDSDGMWHTSMAPDLDPQLRVSASYHKYTVLQVKLISVMEERKLWRQLNLSLENLRVLLLKIASVTLSCFHCFQKACIDVRIG